MNDNECPCLMKQDFELADNKFAFIEDNFTVLDDGITERLPDKELLCCLCMIKSILTSIKKRKYTCKKSQRETLAHKKNEIITTILKNKNSKSYSL